MGLSAVFDEDPLMGLIPDKGLKTKDDLILLKVLDRPSIIQPDPGCRLQNGTQRSCLCDLQCLSPASSVQMGISLADPVENALFPVDPAVRIGLKIWGKK
jgi:hypothetical protein